MTPFRRSTQTAKQQSDEIEKLREDIKSLERCVERLRDRLEVLESFRDNLYTKFDDIKGDLRKYIDSRLPSAIDAHIDMAKIEDKVLLKVVKATFNNYKEEE